MPEVVSRMWSCVLRAAAITLVCATEARAQSLPQLRDGFTESNGSNQGRMYIQLHPRAKRKLSSPEIVERLRPKITNFPAMRVFMTLPPTA